jgi:hypothetical protein
MCTNTADITCLPWLKVKISVEHYVIWNIAISGNLFPPEMLDKTVFNVENTFSFEPEYVFNFVNNLTGAKNVSSRVEHLCAVF